MFGDLAHGFHIVVGHPCETGQQRLETGLHLAAAGGGQCRHGAAVKGFFHHDNGRCRNAFVVAIQTRQLNRGLVGLTTGIAEKNIVHAG